MESKYRRLYKELFEKIERREYSPGDKLPAEGELMEIYGASRDTVRKALELLVEDGCIRKARGKAAEVLDKSKFNFPVSEIASFKEIYRFSDSRPRTFVENLEIVKNDKKLMEALQIGPEDEAFVLERVREIDGKKSSLIRIIFLEKSWKTSLCGRLRILFMNIWKMNRA